MTLPREKLMAFIDGELSPAEENRVAQMVEKDAALRSYVDRQTTLRARLQSEFASVLAEPVPQELEDAVLYTPIRREPAVSDRRMPRIPSVRGWALGLSAVATAAGFAIGIVLAPAWNDSPIGTEGGRLIAQAQLVRALSTQLASEQDPSVSGTRIGLTFRDESGNICRTFVSDGAPNGYAGIGCRDGGDWRIAMLGPAPPRDREAFLPAAAMPALLRESVASMISGEPFDADEERAARDRDWR